jgi:hypothetical protein
MFALREIRNSNDSNVNEFLHENVRDAKNSFVTGRGNFSSEITWKIAKGAPLIVLGAGDRFEQQVERWSEDSRERELLARSSSDLKNLKPRRACASTSFRYAVTRSGVESFSGSVHSKGIVPQSRRDPAKRLFDRRSGSKQNSPHENAAIECSISRGLR